MKLDKNTPHDLIRQEIRNWVDQVLDIPSDHFNGLSACPFAKPALDKGKVDIRIGGKHTVWDTVDYFPPDRDLVIVCPIFADKWLPDSIESFCEQLNWGIKSDDLIAIPFIPDIEGGTEQPDVECENWDYLIDESFPMIFIQRLSELKAATAKLQKRGYYLNVSSKFRDYVESRD